MITTVQTPRINTNDDRVQIVEWHVEEGGFVEAGQPLVDVETSKAVVTLDAEVAGFVARLQADRSVVKVGAPLCRIGDSAEALQQAAHAPAATHAPSAAPTSAAVSALPVATAPQLPTLAPVLSSTGGVPARFSKEAERLLQQHGLSEALFAGAGLVTAQDVQARLGRAAPAATTVPTTAPTTLAAATPAVALLDAPAVPRSEPVSLAKAAEIQSLTTGESGNINSMLTVRFDSAPIRERLRRDRVFDGSLQPLLIYEVSRLLRQYPQLCAYYDDGQLHYYDRVDIGVAIDLGRGLKVVALRDTDRLMPAEIFEKILDIGNRYLDNRIRTEELMGSTLTITDLSGFDVQQFHPLINGRQSMILGVGGDSTQPGHPMTLNATFDHRVTTGREVGLFLKSLRERLLAYGLPVPVPVATPDSAALPAVAPTPWPEPPASTPVASAPAIATLPKIDHCDICGIDRDGYYRQYGKWAFLFAYARDDGTLGGACHRCVNGTV